MGNSTKRAAAVAVAILALAACGGGGDDEATTGTSASGDDVTTTTGDDGGPTTEAEEVVMPDLVGQTEDEARSELGDRGVEDGDILVDERESLEDPGTIIDQVPSSGDRITGSVNLIVAKPVGPVPDFVGEQLTDVEEWAEERDIEVRIEEVLDDGPADGEVLTTTPAADEQATSEILVEVARTPVITQLADISPVGNDCSYDTGDVGIDGETFPNSVFSNYSECGLEYNLGRDWQTLKATVGLSDDSSSAARYRFEVFGDGTSLFNEELVLGTTMEVDVPVEGVLRLRLVMTRIDDEYDTAYATWGNIRVIGSPATVGEDEGEDGSEDGDTTTTEP